MRAEILRLLRETDGYVSGQELCEQFGVSRTAVWKAIKQLQATGYEIEAVPNRGYRLKSSADVLTKDEIASLLYTKWIGKDLYCYDTIGSTNARAKELAEQESEHGTLVVADQQTQGRGRRGRSWQTPPQTGIAMSLLLRPEINPGNASMLTLVTALAVANAITSLSGVEAMIKWPNDVVMNGRKVCGILTEMNAQFDYISYIVIGIGINVHNEQFPEELSQMAGSILTESGKRIHRAELVARSMAYFEQYYETFLKTEDLSGMLEAYNHLLVNRGREVRVLDPKEPFSGRAVGITKKGELMVDTWSSRKLVSSGEVSVRGIYGYV